MIGLNVESTAVCKALPFENKKSHLWRWLFDDLL